MDRAVLRFPILLGGVIAALFFINLAAAVGPPLTMVDPQWQPVTDSQGVSWMIDQQSNLRVNGGQSMLMMVGTLTNNGGQFMPARVQMTPDGSEYVFEGGLNNNMNNPYAGNGPMNSPNGGNGSMVQIVRRIKINPQSATLRFVESVQNTGATPIQMTMTTGNSSMRSSIQSLVGGPSGTALPAATGQPLMSQPGGGMVPTVYGPPNNGMVRLALPAHDCGVVVRNRSNRLPSMLLFAPESKNVKPSIDMQNNRMLQLSFTLTVPAQSTVSVVWGLAQRTLPAALDSQELKNQFKVFQDREWLADLPQSVIKSIVNYGRFNSDGNAPLGTLLQPVLDLASQYDIERGKADILVDDQRAHMAGAVTGSDLSIETSLGKAVVPLGEVALWCGGAGTERPMRVYLRNGEILVGRVEAKDLVLKAQSGVEARLSPETFNLLFLHAAAGDGQTAAGAHAMVETHDGQRLALAAADAQFHAATPWGGLEFGLGEIDRLSVRREPQPVYRLTLKDGSDLSVLLQGATPPLKSLRFGLVKATAGVRQLWSLQAPVAAKQADPEQPTGLAGPHCRLIGENVLAGTIESPKLNLATAGGVLGIPVNQIETAQRNGDPQSGGPLDIQLTDGRHLTGLLTNRTVAIRFHGKVWELPAQHLVGINSGRKAVAAQSSPEPTATGPVKAAPTKDGGILPATAMPVRQENPAPGPVPASSGPPVPALPAQPVPALPAQPVLPLPLHSAPLQPEEEDPFMPPEQTTAQPAPVLPVMPVPEDDNPFGR